MGWGGRKSHQQTKPQAHGVLQPPEHQGELATPGSSLRESEGCWAAGHVIRHSYDTYSLGVSVLPASDFPRSTITNSTRGGRPRSSGGGSVGRRSVGEREGWRGQETETGPFSAASCTKVSQSTAMETYDQSVQICK